MQSCSYQIMWQLTYTSIVSAQILCTFPIELHVIYIMPICRYGSMKILWLSGSLTTYVLFI